MQPNGGKRPIRYGSIACVDPLPASGTFTSFYLDQYTGQNARCDFIWDQIRTAKEADGISVPFDFRTPDGNGCKQDPHGTQLAFTDISNGRCLKDMTFTSVTDGHMPPS